MVGAIDEEDEGDDDRLSAQTPPSDLCWFACLWLRLLTYYLFVPPVSRSIPSTQQGERLHRSHSIPPNRSMAPRPPHSSTEPNHLSGGTQHKPARGTTCDDMVVEE
ncbi:hypothetical protein FRC15_004695 [Serendipita sp. 397]|nr:hypothetical protein FRC15_004695 [Serendipita sp. 397]